MIIRNLRSGRRLAVLAVFAIVAVSAFGFAASNIVPDSKAGDGQGAVSGYTVSNIHYVLDGADPSVIDEVKFDVDSTPAAGSTLKVKLVESGGSWYTCTNAATAITCAVSPALNVTDVEILQFVAAD
jgi:hypothetical protein